MVASAVRAELGPTPIGMRLDFQLLLGFPEQVAKLGELDRFGKVVDHAGVKPELAVLPGGVG